MGLDYFVRRNCPAQETLGLEQFLAHMQRRRQAAIFRPGVRIMIDGELREVELPAGGLGVTTLGPQGATTRNMTHADVAELDVTLGSFSSACTGCAANAAGGPFGCYGYVSYPISGDTEAWLIERAKAGGIDAAVATQALVQSQLTGATCAGLRARGEQFLVEREPRGVIWNLAGGGEVVLSTDLVCDVLLFEAPRQPMLIPILCGLLGLCPPGHGIQDHARTPAEIVKHADLDRLAPETSQQTAIAEYVGALIHAARGGFGVHADG